MKLWTLGDPVRAMFILGGSMALRWCPRVGEGISIGTTESAETLSWEAILPMFACERRRFVRCLLCEQWESVDEPSHNDVATVLSNMPPKYDWWVDTKEERFRNRGNSRATGKDFEQWCSIIPNINCLRFCYGLLFETFSIFSSRQHSQLESSNERMAVLMFVTSTDTPFECEAAFSMDNFIRPAHESLRIFRVRSRRESKK